MFSLSISGVSHQGPISRSLLKKVGGVLTKLATLLPTHTIGQLLRQQQKYANHANRAPFSWTRLVQKDRVDMGL